MSAPSSDDYKLEAQFAVPREAVFDALSTLDGLAGWWTSLVTGTPTAGGTSEFRFAELEEKIVMRVNEATPASRVIWTCLAHTGYPEWHDTTMVFELVQNRSASGVLKFRHIGLNPVLHCYQTCQSGWNHFLASLLSYAQHGTGSPF